MNLLIAESGRSYGLELVKKSEGALKRGSVYVVLGRLEERGYVESKLEEQKPGVAQPRRLYKPTGAGVKVFRALESAGGRAWLREAYA